MRPDKIKGREFPLARRLPQQIRFKASRALPGSIRDASANRHRCVASFDVKNGKRSAHLPSDVELETALELFRFFGGDILGLGEGRPAPAFALAAEG